FGFLGDVAWVTGVVLTCDWVHDVTDHHQSGIFQKRINLRRVGIGDDEHIARIDGLPTTDTGAIKAMPIREQPLSEFPDRDAEMLPQTWKVHKPQVQDPGAFVLGKCNNLTGRHTECPPLWCTPHVHGDVHSGWRP